MVGRSSEYVVDPNDRFHKFKSRGACLLKQTYELSTLCATPACIVISCPELGPEGVFVWPDDQAAFRRVVDLYKSSKNAGSSSSKKKRCGKKGRRSSSISSCVAAAGLENMTKDEAMNAMVAVDEKMEEAVQGRIDGILKKRDDDFINMVDETENDDEGVAAPGEIIMALQGGTVDAPADDGSNKEKVVDDEATGAAVQANNKNDDYDDYYLNFINFEATDQLDNNAVDDNDCLNSINFEATDQLVDKNAVDDDDGGAVMEQVAVNNDGFEHDNTGFDDYDFSSNLGDLEGLHDLEIIMAPSHDQGINYYSAYYHDLVYDDNQAWCSSSSCPSPQMGLWETVIAGSGEYL